jgi:hypothetical protein
MNAGGLLILLLRTAKRTKEHMQPYIHTYIRTHTHTHTHTHIYTHASWITNDFRSFSKEVSSALFINVP